jgi:hypothetical protein
VIGYLVRILLVSSSATSLTLLLWLQPGILHLELPGMLCVVAFLCAILTGAVAAGRNPYVTVTVGTAIAMLNLLCVLRCWLPMYGEDWGKLAYDIVMPPTEWGSLLLPIGGAVAWLYGGRSGAVSDARAQVPTESVLILDYACGHHLEASSAGLLWLSAASACLGFWTYLWLELSDLRRLAVLLLVFAIPCIGSLGYVLARVVPHRRRVGAEPNCPDDER